MIPRMNPEPLLPLGPRMLIWLPMAVANAPSFAVAVSVVPVAAPANSALFYPGDGRALFAGLEYRW